MVACSCSMLFCSLQFYPGNYSDSFFPTFCTCPSLSFLLFLEYLAILKSFRELFGIFVSLPCSFLFYLLLSSKFCVIRLSSFAGDGFGYLFAPVCLAVCVFSCVICQIPYFDFLLDSTKVFFFSSPFGLAQNLNTLYIAYGEGLLRSCVSPESKTEFQSHCLIHFTFDAVCGGCFHS